MPNLHPIFVHFSVALIVTAVAFELAGWLSRSDKLKIVGLWNLILAFAASCFSVASGLLAEESLPHSGAVHALLERHETLGIVTLALVLILLLWRVFQQGRWVKKLLPAYLIIALAALAAVTYGGWLGGEMVYRYGLGVKPVMEAASEAERDDSAGERQEEGRHHH